MPVLNGKRTVDYTRHQCLPFSYIYVIFSLGTCLFRVLCDSPPFPLPLVLDTSLESASESDENYVINCHKCEPVRSARRISSH